jgi:protein-S-isoprenylcysteine O-methyltransferase Ste14
MRASAPPSANANQTTSSGHTVPTVLFICAIAGWAVLEAWQVLRRRRNSGPAATSANRGSLLIGVLGAIVAVAIAILAAVEVPATSVPGGLITFGIGLLIMCSGIFLRWWSVKTPGHPDQPATTTGPYRFTRHPSYLGFIMALTGIGVVLDNWLSIAALVLIPLISLIYLIQAEKKHAPRP